jgi:hypothetical protein
MEGKETPFNKGGELYKLDLEKNQTIFTNKSTI